MSIDPTTREAMASLAHELKNPLTAVKALVQLVLTNEIDDRTRERLRVVLTEVVRMEGILRAQLTPTRASDPGAIDLGALADDVLAVVEGRAGTAGVSLVRHPTTATVDGDAAQLKAALLNLVGNAIEATPAGGRVDVGVDEQDGEIHLDIRDTGHGIAPDDIERLGTPFFTRRADGHGLGVRLARSVVTQHGGTLEYRSEVGAGTLARITLPSRPAAPALPARYACCRAR
jgi:two-component system sensor histidine kinase HydH